jgi:tetratricopeptide (TPR) repeat protein
MRLMERAGYDARSALQLEEAQLAMSENPQIDLKWRRGLFAYHPPLPSRIKVATNTLQELPPGQLQNEQVFERAMAPLKRESPAYDAFDRGVMALAEGDAEVALKYARNAIAIALERESASFYALEALALIALGQEPAALRALNVAVDRNPDYYAHLLQRGLLKQSQGDLDGASTDLERSIALLPTQSAFHALGEIAMERGQNDIATGLFQTSAEAGGPLGRESEQLMVATDVERWLPAVLGINAQGMLEVAVGNRSRLNFSACEVQIFERREGKEVPVTRVTVAPLPSGFYSPRTETGLGPLQAVQLERFRARVASTSQTD